MVNTMTTINIISSRATISILNNHPNSNSSMVGDLLTPCQGMVDNLLIIQGQEGLFIVSLVILDRISGIKVDGSNSRHINRLIMDKLQH